nr:hypothetical protein BaRGS_025133 [Batillaria attramentaria]
MTPSEQSLAVVGGFESEGGGEYEILALPPRPDINFTDNTDSDSDTDSDSSSSDDLRGIGSLFESSSSRTSGSSDLDEEGSNSDLGEFTDDDIDSDLDQIIFANLDDRTVSYI